MGLNPSSIIVITVDIIQTTQTCVSLQASYLLTIAEIECP